jgi:hypothetical protein
MDKEALRLALHAYLAEIGRRGGKKGGKKRWAGISAAERSRTMKAVRKGKRA